MSELLFETFDNQFNYFVLSVENMQNAKYNCLSYHIINRSEANAKLIDILISFGDFANYFALFKSLNPKYLCDKEIVIKLAKRVQKCDSEVEKKFFCALLSDALKCSEIIDLNARIKQFGLKKIANANCDYIKQLLNQITCNDKSQITYDLNTEILIGMN